MEIYTLNSLLQRVDVIDVFESMIWTERFSSWGDFELYLISTPEMRRLLPAGTRLAMSHSYRVMTVELVEDSTDADGRDILKVSGRSLEAILDDRVARNTFASLEAVPKWELTGTPGNIVRKIFNDICRDNSNFPDDEIPFLVTGSLFPAGSIAEPSEVITIELELGTVYEAIKEICDVYDLGFRLVRNFDKSQLYFDIYTGSDRTTFQSTLAPVVFAPNLDNLTNTTAVTSIGDYKNVAYVFHPFGTQIVTADGTSVEVEGFERRVLMVNASDIDIPERPYTITEAQQKAIKNANALSTSLDKQRSALNKLSQKQRLTSEDNTILTQIAGSSSLSATDKTNLNAARNVSWSYNATETAAVNAKMVLRGKEELAKHRQVSAFDGEIPSNSPYPYEIAYRLGDLVEMRNIDGVTNQMRVTEQIFVSDAQGERAYPTLVMNQIIIPGTWEGWKANETWSVVPGEWKDV